MVFLFRTIKHDFSLTNEAKGKSVGPKFSHYILTDFNILDAPKYSENFPHGKIGHIDS